MHLQLDKEWLNYIIATTWDTTIEPMLTGACPITTLGLVHATVWRSFRVRSVNITSAEMIGDFLQEKYQSRGLIIQSKQMLLG
jgi:hypothetical protein